MSDSDDDNVYSDYLASRRAVVAKKRQYVDDDDDFDDEIDNTFRAAMKMKPMKKTRNGVAADEEDVAEVSNVAKVPRTHEELLNSKAKQMEEAFRQSLYNDDMLVTDHSTADGAVKAALEMCDSFNLKNMDDEPADPEKLDTETYNPLSRCVEIDVLDCGEVQNGKTSHMVPLFDTFRDVRKLIATRWKCRIDDVILTLKGVPLDADTTPDSLGIVPMTLPLTVIEAHRKDGPREEVVSDDEDNTHSGGIMLRVYMKNRKKAVHVAARPEMTLLELKAAILNKFPSEPAKMHVKFDNEWLTDDTATLEEIGLDDADCLHIYN